jgi:hypothetical protein
MNERVARVSERISLTGIGIFELNLTFLVTDSGNADCIRSITIVHIIYGSKA